MPALETQKVKSLDIGIGMCFLGSRNMIAYRTAEGENILTTRETAVDRHMAKGGLWDGILASLSYIKTKRPILHILHSNELSIK